MKIAGIVDNSTIDYPGKNCAVIYLCGCDFRCPWCHNKQLVLEDPEMCKEVNIKDVIKRINENFLIDGVCITGGEPLMTLEGLVLIKALKANRSIVKIDTNGSYTDNLAKILDSVDFISMDIKAPFEKYSQAIGVSDAYIIIENVKKSLELLKKVKTLKEARTTIVPGLNDSEEDMEKLSQIVKDHKFNLYTLQQFRPKNTIDPAFEAIPSPSYEQMKKLGQLAKKNLGIRVRIATSEHGFEYLA